MPRRFQAGSDRAADRHQRLPTPFLAPDDEAYAARHSGRQSRGAGSRGTATARPDERRIDGCDVRLAIRVPPFPALVRVERERLLDLGERPTSRDARRDACRQLLEVAKQVGRVLLRSRLCVACQRMVESSSVMILSASIHEPIVGVTPPGRRRTCKTSALNTARSSGKWSTALSSAWAIPRWIILTRLPPSVTVWRSVKVVVGG